LKQKVEFTSQVKNVLDSWVRQEAAVREAEQKRLVAQVIENVKAKLLDPKTQQSILAQNLADIEKLSLSK
jgi:F-type H+-transporting ATPase subunit b